jgi:tetratricopeptide (TPR) repeat protein
MTRISILAIGTIVTIMPAFGQAAAPASAPATATAKGPSPKSAAENDAVLAMFKATDANGQIQAADDLLKKYPDTDYKAQALLVQAQAYHSKKDEPKAIVAGEQAVEADPKSFDALLLLAEIYSRTTRVTDLDMDDRLTKSDKCAKEALDLLVTAEKPKPEVSDADWAGLKQGESQRAWLALGFSALLRRKFDEAKTNFEKGISLYPDPLDMLYIERGYLDAKRYDDAVAWIDKAVASPNADDRVKQIAGQDRTRALNLKKQQ